MNIANINKKLNLGMLGVSARCRTKRIVSAPFALFLKMLAIGLCLVAVMPANAMPPIVLTRDKLVSADLTGTPLLEKQRMQDCQLRLEGKPSNYRLVYSGGMIPVPTKAVKKIRDGYWIDMFVKGKIGELSVRMLSIPYFAKPLTNAEIFGLDGLPPKFVGREVSFYIVFEGHESVVEPKLREIWLEGVMLNHRNHPNPNIGTLQYLADKSIADPVGGMYGVLPLQSQKTTTTVNYYCVLHPESN